MLDWDVIAFADESLPQPTENVKKGSIAERLDSALEKEFHSEELAATLKSPKFNETLAKVRIHPRRACFSRDASQAVTVTPNTCQSCLAEMHVESAATTPAS
jgi:hypothetical protein